MTNYDIWQSVLGEFEVSLSKANFTTWFRNTGIAEFSPQGEVTIAVPTAFIKSWLERKYHTDIVKSLERITSKPVKKVTYKVESLKNVEEQELSFEEKTHIAPTPMRRIPAQPRPHIESAFGINHKYSFESFIVGKGNELAHAAAQAVANRPGEAYNPLFIYGGVGLGKTHLLQAIANKMLGSNPQTKILYVSSEKFTNEFVAAVKEGRAKEFKERYRNVDLLLIDDIQFIAGKEQTQEEFFHTFNELHQNGKQVVLTSDRPPKAIPALEDRLRSRFEWGMIADVSAPDLETRIAIIESKCQEKGFTLANNIVTLIATTVQSNIRELEGALNKVIAFHELKNIAPSEETVRGMLSTFASQQTKKVANPQDVLNVIMSHYGISEADLKGKSREKRLSFPRQIAMFLLREEMKLSYPAIGQELGGRDHTTAMHAHTKISKKIEEDPKLKEDIELLLQRINNPQ